MYRAAGGLFGGFFQLKCFEIGTPAIVTIVQYVEESRPMSLLIAALTILITSASCIYCYYANRV
ncbi:MAG: hypothetical protein ACLTCI_06530 [[Clostridium] nexile]